MFDSRAVQRRKLIPGAIWRAGRQLRLTVTAEAAPDDAAVATRPRAASVATRRVGTRRGLSQCDRGAAREDPQSRDDEMPHRTAPRVDRPATTMIGAAARFLIASAGRVPQVHPFR